MPVLAGFTTFLGYLGAGLLALFVTALLDRRLGKERALLLYAVALVAVTWLVRPKPPPPLGRVAPRMLEFDARTGDPTARLAFARTGPALFEHAPVPEERQGRRNPFREFSDTNPLPPIVLPTPPDVALPFPLPPTVPGLGPAARRGYRAAAVPPFAPGDGSALPAVPRDAYVSYATKPEDVFDWFVDAGSRRQYVVVKSIDGAKEGTPDYERSKWTLVTQGSEPKPWDQMEVEFAIVGPEDQARAVVADLGRFKGKNVSRQRGQWKSAYLRRTVDNLYRTVLRDQGGTDESRLTVEALRRAAAEMAQIGLSGKEDGKGWRYAVSLLQRALSMTAQAGAAVRLDVLTALLEAQRAVHDERGLLATLAEYVATHPDRAEGSAWLGDVYLTSLGLPLAAVEHYRKALSQEGTSRTAMIGLGDAWAQVGEWEKALEAYQKAGRAGPEVSVRVAECYLRLGRLADARREVEAALSAAGFDARALVAKGAIQYAGGDLQGARDTFAQAASLPGDGLAGEGARRHRAEALFDLGLCEWRLGHGDAARAAADAVDEALSRGSQPGRTPDETVSSEALRALLSLGAGQAAEAVETLARAPAQAPGCAYVRMLEGILASRAGDMNGAALAFERSRALAPGLLELDGWISQTRLQQAEEAVTAGVPPAESAAAFEGALAFAARAAAEEARTDKKSADFGVRLALARLRAAHWTERRRFDEARKAALDVLSRVKEDRRAFAVLAYCHYRLGAYDRDLYDECLRNFQRVIELPAPDDDPVKRYAKEQRAAVVHWQALEEKVVLFGEGKLPPDVWVVNQSKGVRADADKELGVLRFSSPAANDDTTLEDPAVQVFSTSMFDRSTIERLSFKVWIPREDRGGPVNAVTFGVLIQGPTKGTIKKAQAGSLGVFFDRGKVAVRAVGTQDPGHKKFAAGEPLPILLDGQPLVWPEPAADGSVLVEVERENDDGTMVLRLGGREVFRDKMSAWKRTAGGGAAELWFGGWSTKAARWEVHVDELRVVRRKKS